jgi:CDP-diacylglycerol--serine O-phosphatidyltransferase
MIALVLIVNHLPKYATTLILFSAIFDLLDGRIARALKEPVQKAHKIV